jgi:catechol 2,3-dioxygenase-like lactoylglutathione lyase family enzyme
MPDELVNVRYMVDDVEESIDFYTAHFGFTLRSSAAPAFADDDEVDAVPASRCFG